VHITFLQASQLAVYALNKTVEYSEPQIMHKFYSFIGCKMLWMDYNTTPFFWTR